MVEIKTFLLICQVAFWIHTAIGAICAFSTVLAVMGKIKEEVKEGEKPMGRLGFFLIFGGATILFGGTATILYLVPNLV